jgi:hypothetical protein
MPSICIVAGLNLAFNHTKFVSVAMEMQQWLPFAVLQSYKIFRTVVNNTTVITYFFMQNYLFFPI